MEKHKISIGYVVDQSVNQMGIFESYPTFAFDGDDLLDAILLNDRVPWIVAVPRQFERSLINIYLIRVPLH